MFEKFCSKFKPKQNLKIFLEFWIFQNIFSKYFEILKFLGFQNYFEIWNFAFQENSKYFGILKFLGFQNYFEILIFCFSRKIKIILKIEDFENFSKIILKFWPKQNFGKIILNFDIVLFLHSDCPVTLIIGQAER